MPSRHRASLPGPAVAVNSMFSLVHLGARVLWRPAEIPPNAQSHGCAPDFAFPEDQRARIRAGSGSEHEQLAQTLRRGVGPDILHFSVGLRGRLAKAKPTSLSTPRPDDGTSDLSRRPEWAIGVLKR